MPIPPLVRLLRLALTKSLLLALEDGLKGEARKARDIVRDHVGLKNRRRARESEGQLRFRMMEERFEEVCQLYGGKLLDGGVIPTTDLKVFQPFCRFEVDGQGFIFGLAAMSEPKFLPSKNKSRVAAVKINCQLTPGLFDTEGPKMGDVFVLLLVSRDRERAGIIEEMAIGIIDAKYESFLFYEPLGKFISELEGVTAPTTVPPTPAAPSIKLKKGVTPYVPPEAVPEEEKKDTGTK
ncbi:MAG: hypothetical protein INH13_04970 [Cupriavidus sp.]|nr:hypothetical protein [Cupriavidus sp.]MCA3704328.1 hypothetical protein [Methylobacterium sp.]